MRKFTQKIQDIKLKRFSFDQRKTVFQVNSKLYVFALFFLVFNII